jgi:transcription initiation factor IIE alpha subunit
MKQRILEKLKTRLHYEQNHEFYRCQTPGCKRLTFKEAVEFLFKCPTCHKPMTHLDKNHIIKALTHKIEQVKEELMGHEMATGRFRQVLR